MNRQNRISEIIELMNIPEFEKLINIKVEELKIILERQIRLYNKLKNEFKSEGKEKLRLFENKSMGHGSDTYFFELNRVEDVVEKLGCSWIIRKIEPEVSGNVKEVVPFEIIQKLSQHETNPSKIEFDEYYSESLRINYYVRSIKYNDSRIFGTIRLVSDQNELEDSFYKNGNDTITLSIPREQVENEKKYTELFSYMEKYPEIKEHIFTYFFMIQKPMVDKAEDWAPSEYDKVVPK